VHSVAKLRSADLEKSERQSAEIHSNVSHVKPTFAEARKTYRLGNSGAATLKQRSKDYYAGQRQIIQMWNEWFLSACAARLGKAGAESIPPSWEANSCPIPARAKRKSPGWICAPPPPM
jgi:hypothetical protein